jgi:hypothetical protein
MSDDDIMLGSEVNNIICEAASCCEKATIVVPVRVGQKGSIALYLCQKCQSKFEDN